MFSSRNLIDKIFLRLSFSVKLLSCCKHIDHFFGKYKIVNFNSVLVVLFFYYYFHLHQNHHQPTYAHRNLGNRPAEILR